MTRIRRVPSSIVKCICIWKGRVVMLSTLTRSSSFHTELERKFFRQLNRNWLVYLKRLFLYTYCYISNINIDVCELGFPSVFGRSCLIAARNITAALDTSLIVHCVNTACWVRLFDHLQLVCCAGVRSAKVHQTIKSFNLSPARIKGSCDPSPMTVTSASNVTIDTRTFGCCSFKFFNCASTPILTWSCALDAGPKM